MEKLFQTAAVKPWKTCFPRPPADYDWESITVFTPLVAVVLAITLAIVFTAGRRLKLMDKIIFGFLVLSTIIHFGLERYWVTSNELILDKTNMNWSARLWRHFGASDTRWWGPQKGVDPAVTGCIFGIEWLAAWLCGPTAVLAAVLVVIQSPWRFVITPVTVTAEAYGLMMTWISAFWENLRSVPANDPVLFYGYFWGWQLPWVVFPLMAIIQSGLEISKAFHKAKALEISEKDM